VAASLATEGLHCAIRSTEPYGRLTSVVIHFGDLVGLPMLEMYTRGITVHTSRADSRRYLPEVLDLVAAGRLDPAKVDERTVARHLDEPDMPDVDLFVRSSGEQRTSNFLLWESAYAEMVFLDRLWPAFTRTDLWEAMEQYLDRDRRFGGAVDKPTR